MHIVLNTIEKKNIISDEKKYIKISTKLKFILTYILLFILPYNDQL